MERENRLDREKKTEIDNIEDLASLLLPNTDRHTHTPQICTDGTKTQHCPPEDQI